MKRAWLGIVVAAVVVVAVGVGLWLINRPAAYVGLAGRFPAKTGAFVEIHHLGQWMGTSQPGRQASAADSTRGMDPMLQVLGQVWAAQPLRPVELPELLSPQPMAAGLWREGGKEVGAAVILLAPGQSEPVREFLAKHLGEGPSAGEVAGITLRKVSPKEPSDNVGLDLNMVWGVGDVLAVVATGVEEARAVVTPREPSLAKDPDFMAVMRRLEPEQGATLFVRGTLIAEAAKEKQAKWMGQDDAAAGESKEPKAADAAPEPLAAVPDTPPAAPETKPEKKEAPAEKPEAGFKILDGKEPLKVGLKDLAKGASKLMALDSIRGIGLWTLPPAEGETTWKTRFWLGFNGAPQGVWRILAEGSARRPDVAARIPKDGLLYVWGGGRDPARVYQAALDEAAKDFPPEQVGWVRAGLGAVEGKLGLSFANDLLPTLSDEWCLVVKGRGAEGSPERSVAFYVPLRDARRFEDLLTNRLAPQLGLVKRTESGAEIWTMKSDAPLRTGGSLVVAGGVAILTSDPSWALSSEGAAGKAYEKLASMRERASGYLVMDPALMGKSAAFTQASWTTEPDGVRVDASFPGKRPKQVLSEEKDKETAAVVEEKKAGV